MKNKTGSTRRARISTTENRAILADSNSLLRIWKVLLHGGSRTVISNSQKLTLRRSRKYFMFFLSAYLLGTMASAAEPLFHAANNVLPGLIEPKRLSVLLETMVTLTFISFVPSLFMMTTSFLRMIIVMSFIRHALGTQQTPPNHILISLALILTCFVMAPTWKKVNEVAIQPYQNKSISWTDAINRGLEPVQTFMLKQTRKRDLAVAMKLSGAKPVSNVQDVSFPVAATAFIMSELKTAFQIGFLIFIPFLVIDLVVASVLMSLGMMMVPPSIISLPLKILLFVMIDGWSLLIQGLVQSVRV